MSKILFIETITTLPYGRAMVASLRKLGHNVKEPEYVTIKQVSGNESLIKKQNILFKNIVDEFQPDIILIINNLSIESNFLAYCKNKGIRLCMFCYDSIRWCGNAMKCMGYYDDIFSYEPLDEKIEFKTGKFIKYLPLGYDSAFLKPLNTPFSYDICFVGDLDKRRTEILNAVANWAYKNNKKFVVHTAKQIKNMKQWRLFFKIMSRKLRFRWKYPHLYEAIVNEPVFGNELCLLYNSSKICLNINVGKDPGMHTGTNPRTFEILGCKSFELIDAGHLSRVDIESGRDLVEFNSTADLLEKLSYYLENEEERCKIAEQGLLKVKAKYSCDILVAKMLEMIDCGS